MLRKKSAEFIVFVITFIAVRNLLEYLYCRFTGAPFVFDPVNGLVMPLPIAMVLAYLLFFYRKP